MRVGFTAAREGLSLCQKHALASLLRASGATEFHHGCCVGGDAWGHACALALGIPIHGHPAAHPLRDTTLAGFAVLHEPLPPLVRNARIAACDLVIAAPLLPEDLAPRSGTWHTVRLARAAGVPVEVLQRYRDGWTAAQFRREPRG